MTQPGFRELLSAHKKVDETRKIDETRTNELQI